MSAQREPPDVFVAGRPWSFWFGLGLLAAPLASTLARALGPWRASAGLLVAVAAIALGGLVARGRRAARRRQEADRAARRARGEDALRLLRGALADFDPDRWGRRALGTLRLLALNLAPRQDLGPRLAERLAFAVSAVRWGVLDRLNDVLLMANEAELARPAQGRLRAAALSLSAELDGAVCAAGAPLPFHPAAVALACAQAADACDELRGALSPALVADLARILEVLAAPGRVPSGPPRWTLTRRPQAGAATVAVRGADLARALAGLAAHAVEIGVGPIEVAVEASAGEAVVSMRWSAAAGRRVDPRNVIDVLRPLSSYGARIVVEETPPDGGVRVDLFLPSAASRAIPAATARRADAS